MKENNTGIIQLEGVDGDPIGLYSFDKRVMSVWEAAKVIESTFDDCRETDSPQEYADEKLELMGIIRVTADSAYTDVI